MDAPKQCWFCKALDSLDEQVDKERPDMVYYKCKHCGATDTGIKPKRRK